MLVERVQTTARSTCGGGDVLLFPPAVDQSEGGEPSERAVHTDLLDVQAIRHLEPVELGGTFPVDAQTFEQDLRVELEQESASGPEP